MEETAKTPDEEPIVLELAQLPREQLGPFLLLGVDKDAGPEQIEAHWAKRVLWARKNQIRSPLGDINWAREVIQDPDRRVHYALMTLNADTGGGVIRHLAEKYGLAAEGSVPWQPLEVEWPGQTNTPEPHATNTADVPPAVAPPEVPEEFPAVLRLLDEFARAPIDPWQENLFGSDSQDPSP
jgi:hypothetical protein